MPTISFSITDIEQTILIHVMPNPLEWISNSIRNKARNEANRLILSNTDLNPLKLSDQQRIQTISDMNLQPFTPSPE